MAMTPRPRIGHRNTEDTEKKICAFCASVAKNRENYY